jgi:hypothetical protein
MSINKMTTFSTLAAVYRRASSVVFTTPAEGTTPFVRFVEEDVISDAEGTRYSPAGSSLFADIDVSDAAEFVLYDTSGAVDENPDFNETSITDLMAMDNDRTTDLPVKGSFTNQDIADLLFSMYIYLSEQRANAPVEPEPVEEPDGGTE